MEILTNIYRKRANIELDVELYWRLVLPYSLNWRPGDGRMSNFILVFNSAKIYTILVMLISSNNSFEIEGHVLRLKDTNNK